MNAEYDFDLASLKDSLKKVKGAGTPAYPESGRGIVINPSLQLLRLEWKNLCALLRDPTDNATPLKEAEFVVLYKRPQDGKVCFHPATDENLLALKIMGEALDRKEIAAEAAVSVGRVDAAIGAACEKGILLAPASLIRRTGAHLPENSDEEGWQQYRSSNYFTLQWHVTQACDLHCKHCYDRSEISPLTLEQGIVILDQFRDFVLAKNVRGQVTFTGGNPLLYKNFKELYQEAASRNFAIAILGNPASKNVIKSLQDIQPLSFFQVSLEGLPAHNDSIRGRGHFERVLEFLQVLKDLSIYSMVMLTLTRENMGQVIELGEILKDKVDLFTFNRLSQTGEGASLAMAAKDDYRQFLSDYLEAAGKNRVMSLKDNLINIVKLERGEQLFGGCTGFGCGAAFNFCSLLPDGNMHACRKFNSPIGNVLKSSLLELYDSEAAERYRLGPEECRGCRIRPVCGGCQAVVQSSGLDCTVDRDPYCFLQNG